MPIYEFVNTKTKKIEEYSMSVSAYDQFKADNPHLERYYSEAPMFSYSGAKDFNTKTDNTWKEVIVLGSRESCQKRKTEIQTVT